MRLGDLQGEKAESAGRTRAQRLRRERGPETSHRTHVRGCFPRSCTPCVTSGRCTSGQLFTCQRHLHAHSGRRAWTSTFPRWLRARSSLAALWTGKKSPFCSLLSPLGRQQLLCVLPKCCSFPFMRYFKATS